MTAFFEVKNVTFSSSKDHKLIDVNFCIKEQGQIISILGPSGVGKSTIINNLSNDFSPWVRSVGYGIKLPIFLPWRIEAAYDWTESGLSKPQWYVSLGYDW